MHVIELTPAELTGDRSLLTALLDLNNAHASELSLLTAEGFANLVGLAWKAWRIGHADALMITLDERAAYDNPNHRWFRARYDRFVYVDRIVVAPSARGRGLARRLYEQLIREATAAGYERVVCEVNLDPPNPQSDAFHAALGFTALEAASIHGGAKTVRYMVRPVR
ncbi:GNAT family acetyltransferase [Bradyrhizobium sp. SSBR45G]|uniref:GNAT family N-acetyltransferase n=1 Tax=unclassified Bradyrhizobium TaxID=2631580 RepID=UPI002342A9CF|nr:MULTISPECIES: GNAT family N-acetyltransferase [unclassified Bradyrhizobium]GLH77697.1 GNAT family acetyltransferase [Bradyrhizobium sp. SSBR45G]GLH84934.1 GNAT family acetyltransferase [Bradyrhizobium sp. SSBR45R]